MLVVNKLALYYNPFPAMIMFLQILCTVLFILLLGMLELSEVDGLDWPRVKVFLPYTVSFVLVLYSNGRAIEHTNIDTVIVFRAAAPLLVCKKLCQGVQFKAPVWGQVLYCNALGLAPMLAIAFSTGESSTATQSENGINATTPALLALGLSCVVGVCIAWAVWNCRNQVAATTFTLIGVVCKLISVILNVVIWDKHATPIGIFWLLVCLGCSSLYQQAPLLNPPAPAPAACSKEMQAAPAVQKVAAPAEQQVGRPSDELHTQDEVDELLDAA